MGGVLVFVEEDGPPPVAFGAGDLGGGVDESGGECELVGEVHDAQFAFALLPGGDQGEQLLVFAQERDEGAVVLVVSGGAARFEFGGGVAAEGAQVVLAAEVFGEFAGEAQDEFGDLVDADVEFGHLAVPGGDDVAGELPAAGLGDHAGVGFDADADAVFGDQARGVRVVGGDGRFAVERGEFGESFGEFAEFAADAGGQFGGGFAGEGQAEDVFGADDAVGDEPDDAVGHGGGLARAGAGDDEEGGGAGFDDGLLLFGGCGFAEPVGQADGAVGGFSHR